jgi:hypothetical protein
LHVEDGAATWFPYVWVVRILDDGLADESSGRYAILDGASAADLLSTKLDGVALGRLVSEV